MTSPRIAEMLRATSGLDAEALGRGVLTRALHRRMKQLHIGSEDEYALRLEGSPDEMQALVDDVVVHETSFYRDAGAFAAFTDWVRNTWLPLQRAARPLSILSIPCSTGEEAYSIAMTLLDMSENVQFRIDAVDISTRALRTARAGEYGSGSFRSKDLAYRARYFDAVSKTQHRVKDELKDHITFRQGNLLKPEVPGREYDVVFCRNLLIYFDSASQQRGMAALASLVAEGGLLFLGPAETFLTANTVFRSIAKPMAFAFEKMTSVVKSDVAAARKPSTRKPVVAARPPSHTAPPKRSGASVKPARVANASSAKPDDALDRAEALADAGQLAEAAELCRAHVASHGPSARAFFLLGVVSDAQGDAPAAVSWFRKAVYLEPTHEQALSHLSVHRRGS